MKTNMIDLEKSREMGKRVHAGWDLPLDPDFRLECIPPDLIDVYKSACASIGIFDAFNTHTPHPPPIVAPGPTS